jgi:thiol-disulfide isomerase/thioredoxin
MSSAKRWVVVSVMVTLMPAIAAAVTSNDLWSKFEALRQGSRALHQEFEVTRHVKTAYVEQASSFQTKVDIALGRWREQAIGGEDELTRVFNGQDLLTFDAGGTEYTRTKGHEDKDESLPQPYAIKLDWSKSKELQRLPCGFAGKDQPCLIVEAPIKGWMRPGSLIDITRMTGTARVMIDPETGIWLQCRMVEMIEGPSSSYRVDLTYVAKRMSYGAAADPALFTLPDGLNEVRELTPWNAARIKKQLVGKPAPELQLTDIQGKKVSLADLKGKTVLLDFWTTWCPPCQADAPSIDKLNQKYGEKSLAIIGISVNEGRDVVEKYLKKHPHSYPLALSGENQMPRAYQIRVFPTYLIIDANGALITAEEGDQGFAKLRKELQKAGLEPE